MFARGLKGHLVQPWTLCRQSWEGHWDTEMTQGVSEDLSLTADRCRGKTSGLSTSPCCPVSRATLWVLVPFSVNMNLQWTEMQWYKIISPTHCSLGFLGGADSKEPTCQRTRHSRHGFDPSVRKIP